MKPKTGNASEAAKAVDEDFEEVVLKASHKKPVVVDFHADWCGPCHALAPVLERLAAESKKFSLVKVNIESNPLTADSQHVSAIPLVKMFKSGQSVAEFVGAMPESAVREWLEKNL